MADQQTEPGEPNKSVIRETDDDARRLAKSLVRTARFGAIAALQPETGHPLASRVAVASDLDGTPVILASTLSGHTSAILNDARCSLLAGEPGKGDPLAHPRITLFCSAERLEHDGVSHLRVRKRYLARHPKAALYADFGDFAFFRLNVVGASLNGGFGKAFELGPEDLLSVMDDLAGWSELDAGACTHMNEDHTDAVQLYAEQLCKAGPGNWKMACLDPEGADLVSGDKAARLWFDQPLASPDALRSELASLAKRARQAAKE